MYSKRQLLGVQPGVPGHAKPPRSRLVTLWPDMSRGLSVEDTETVPRTYARLKDRRRYKSFHRPVHPTSVIRRFWSGAQKTSGTNFLNFVFLHHQVISRNFSHSNTHSYPIHAHSPLCPSDTHAHTHTLTPMPIIKTIKILVHSLSLKHKNTHILWTVKEGREARGKSLVRNL